MSTDTTVWRDALSQGRAHLQSAIGHAEEKASLVRAFQPSILPGLLQSADYAGQVFRMFGMYDQATLRDALAARLQRQAGMVSRAGTHAFEFIVTEAALRFQPGQAAAHGGQLRHIAKLMADNAASIAVIPAGVPATVTIPHGYTVYYEAGLAVRVSIELLHAGVTVHAPDLEPYLHRWGALAGMARHGRAAEEFVAALIRELGY